MDYLVNVIERDWRWTFELAPLPEGILGRCFYAEQQITIDDDIPSARTALVTIAHEMGHVIDFRRRDFSRKVTRRWLPVDRRETLAYLYGWLVLRHVKSDLTHQEWRDYHYDES